MGLESGMINSNPETVSTAQGTHDFLRAHSVETRLLPKISEGSRPNILDRLTNREIHLIINTPTLKGAHTDEGRIRALAVRYLVPMITTATGARAAVQAIAALRAGTWQVAALQDYAPGSPSVTVPDKLQPCPPGCPIS